MNERTLRRSAEWLAQRLAAQGAKKGPQPAQIGALQRAKPVGEDHPFQWACVRLGLPGPIAEYRFAPPRRWRFDWAWPGERVALEVQGGVWVRGHHSRGQSQIDDMEKYSEAAILGWHVIYCVPSELLTVGIERARRALG